VPLRVEPVDEQLRRGFSAIREELGISTAFSDAVEAEARAVAHGPITTPDVDLRDVPFFTIDPPGSRDLDQAMWIEAGSAGRGWIVSYAIADVAAFVVAGGGIDAEARERGVTVYLPDARAPLHPTVLSEGAASLLPGEDRPALVWRIVTDGDGEVTDVGFRRALVRSREALSYEDVQAAVDRGTAEEPISRLRDFGIARERRQQLRGGLDLRLPSQDVRIGSDGRYELEYRAPVPAEGWNAQVSLLAGECAASLMLDAGVGILRTLPPPSEETVARLRRHAHALGIDWPAATGYAEFLRGLDPREPEHAALIVQSAKLARGAGYLAFTTRPTGDVAQSAVTAPYAHVTAPLRRLVDRTANELTLAACAGRPPAEWAVAALEDLPEQMDRARHRERAAEGMAVDLVEAAVLAGCKSAVLDGVVVDIAKGRAKVQLAAPAVVTSVPARALKLGDEIRVKVHNTDLAARAVHLEVVDG
jgi:exoribonuclease R